MVDLPTVNFEVTEVWTMTCPYCAHEGEAPFNDKSPMSPMEVECMECDGRFILTYNMPRFG